MESSMQVTPGFGAGVSTKVLDNKHNQNVIAHADGYLGRVIPAATALTYSANESIGGELEFQDAMRCNGGVGRLVAVRVNTGAESSNLTPDLDLVLYATTPQSVPADSQGFGLSLSEAHGVLAVVKIRAADYVSVGSFRAVARVASNALLQAAAGSKSIRGVLLARGNLTLPAPDAISVALDIDRN